MQISHSNHAAQAFACPPFPQCAYAFSSDPTLQGRSGPKVYNLQQLAFLEGFADGRWKPVSVRDESHLIDGDLYVLGWRFDYRRSLDPITTSEYRLMKWQIRLLKRLSRRLAQENLFPSPEAKTNILAHMYSLRI